MNRRTTLKAIAAASVGTVALGYWAKDLDYIRDLMSKSFFKPTEQDLITSIADTIIPKTTLYGALDLGVPVYLLGYFEKCTEAEDQAKLKQQLQALDQKTNEQYSNDFVDCNQTQREEALLAFSNSESEDEKWFFKLMKDQTIRGFRTTEEVMTERYHYRIMPGHYKGCIDINQQAVT